MSWSFRNLRGLTQTHWKLGIGQETHSILHTGGNAVPRSDIFGTASGSGG